MLRATQYLICLIALLLLNAAPALAQERMLAPLPAGTLQQEATEGPLDEGAVARKGQFLEIPRLTQSFSQGVSNETGVFSENFETGASDWHTQDEWEVGAPEVGPPGGYNSPNLAGTDLNGPYDNNVNEALSSPMISLEDVPPNANIMLRFAEWFDLESGYDFGSVWVTTDFGNNWIRLNRRSGSSDWRITEVDLTSYAGEEIVIAFQLTSDGSVTGDGWYVDDVEIVKAESEPLTASISSLNSQNFPNIYANVAVDTSGVGMPDLTQDNFAVYENGTLQTDLFNVTPPEEGGGVRRADVVFLMDNSGSMGEEQAAVEDNVFDFVDALAASDVDFALGLARYGANENGGNPIIEDGGSLTSDAAYFKNDVWMRNVTELTLGEPGYYAITESAGGFSFRPGAKRIFIIITDETPDQGGATLNEAFAALTGGDITLFALTEDNYYDEFQPLTAATGGAFFDIYSPFHAILDFIAEQVASTYVVSYRSGNPTFDGTPRTVRVEVTHDGNTAFDEASYIPGAAPSIVRTAETIALSDEGRAQGTQLVIEAEIADAVAPSVQNAQLFYKHTSDDTYTSVDMTLQSGNVYQGIIPGAAVVEPGMDYYITATDGISTSSKPSTNPGANPYQIAILPNQPPAITHTPITTAPPGEPIDVQFIATDGTNVLVKVQLYYRRAGGLTYQVETFDGFVNMSDFLLPIPAEYVTTDGVDYYIKATDDTGISSTSGTADEPHVVTTALPQIRLTDVYVREQGESSFSRYAPSEVVGVHKGSEVRFRGLVTDESGSPLSERRIRVYNSFLYNPDMGENGIRVVETDSDGTFRYPSEDAISTGSTPAGVRPFWFNVADTDEAIPFALYLYDESHTFGILNQKINESEDPSIHGMSLSANTRGNFDTLFVSSISYPREDLNTNSIENDKFFIYYAVVYAGPTGEDFLLSEDFGSGWLRRGFNLYQARVNAVLNNLPERFEPTMPLLQETTATSDLVVEPMAAKDYDPLNRWNLVMYAIEGLVCASTLAPTGVTQAIGPVGCAALKVHIAKDVAKTVVTSDRVQQYAGLDGNDMFDRTLVTGIDVAFLLYNTTDPSNHISHWSSPTSLIHAIPGRPSIGAELIFYTEEVGNLAFDGWRYAQSTASHFHNPERYFKGSEIENLQFVPQNLSSPVKHLNLSITRPSRPFLTLEQVQLSETELTITATSDRVLYKRGTTAQSTPALRINETDFPMEQVNRGLYQAEIPVSQLPGFNGNPDTWSEPITVDGSTFETRQGICEGCLCGIEDEVLELEWEQSDGLNMENANSSKASTASSAITTLEIPANSFGGQAVFTSLAVASYSQFASPEQPGLRPLSPAINVNTDGHDFSQPATLTIALDQLRQNEDASVYRHGENGRWNKISSTISRSDGTATATIASPGFYAILTGGESIVEPPAAPQLLSPSNEATEISTVPHLSWGVAGRANQYQVQLSTSRDFSESSAREYTTTKTTVVADLLEKGTTYYWRVRAENSAGKSPWSGAAEFTTYDATLTRAIIQSFGNPESQRSYRLVALPGASSVPVESTLEGEAGEDWRVFYDNGQAQDYLVEYDGSDRFQFAPGRGFWMLSESAWTSSGTVETVSLREDGTFTIDVHDGWNIISNPFGVKMDWTAVQEANGITQALWQWSGSYDEATAFASAATGAAFYFFNEQGLDELKLPYPTAALSSVKQAKARQDSSEAQPTVFTLVATVAGDTLASRIQVGLASEAKRGFDALDQYAPPGHFAPTRLHLLADFAAESGHDRLAAEYRPEGQGQRFEIVLGSKPGQPVSLWAEGSKAFAGREIVLVERGTLRRYDLRREPTVLVQLEKETLRLTLLIGSSPFVEQAADDLAPKTSKLLGNYPNPFTRQATIAYIVAEPSDVRLVVYDLLGRRVRVLVNERQEPGREEVVFDRRGLASGLYVYRLEIGSYQATGKLMLVR